ncbi:nitroreductase family protein [Cellulophaga sp. HaHaR_3_176]|uniref:nitroreductase family protein n=1 Tax=Cellulophaga sp. HaHaR_3_176 TaxID=1942464 RepID=UPI001C1FE0DD|nr:nitroreductase family protein [Cellulophaga sp. HaHaR_3_176]QWX83876.1 nitroreductase family protein [Cellulophaga sp. HaHaR_3_176]
MIAPEQVQLENIADGEYEIFALLKQRYSPRTFKKEKIKEQHIKQLFEAVRWSASSNNIQPWRFLYAEKNTESYNEILSCLSDFNKEWAINAPLLMLTAYKEETEDGDKNFHAPHDLGLSIGGMTMQAQYMGIALHHMAGIDWEEAQDVFNIPEGYHINSAIAVGYYGGELDQLSTELQKQELNERKRIRQTDFAYKGEWKF